MATKHCQQPRHLTASSLDQEQQQQPFPSTDLSVSTAICDSSSSSRLPLWRNTHASCSLLRSPPRHHLVRTHTVTQRRNNALPHTWLVLQMLDQAHADMYSLKQQLRDTQLVLVDSQHGGTWQQQQARQTASGCSSKTWSCCSSSKESSSTGSSSSIRLRTWLAPRSRVKHRWVGCLGLLALPSSSVAVAVCGIPPLSYVEGWT
jgi:hypothetical protein